MAVEIVMPRFGWTMEEGVLVEWMKRDGDAVKAGELLFTVEGDKALNEVESFDTGTLRLPPDSPHLAPPSRWARCWRILFNRVSVRRLSTNKPLLYCRPRSGLLQRPTQ